MKTILSSQLAIAQVILTPSMTRFMIGCNFARKYLSRQNFVKDMDISIERFLPTSASRKAPKYRLFSSTL